MLRLVPHSLILPGVLANRIVLNPELLFPVRRPAAKAATLFSLRLVPTARLLVKAIVIQPGEYARQIILKSER